MSCRVQLEKKEVDIKRVDIREVDIKWPFKEERSAGFASINLLPSIIRMTESYNTSSPKGERSSPDAFPVIVQNIRDKLLELLRGPEI